MTNRKLMVYLENSQHAIPVTYKLRMLLRRAILETLDYEGSEIAAPEVSMTFTDNEGIRELNRLYRNIDRPTDVLSFPMFDFSDEDEIVEGALGDIVISLERAREQAETFGHSFEREVAFLCVHSMLHLLGYDHELGEQEDIDMRRRQREIVARLGLAIQTDERTEITE
jgi:probable rRNA maturation factor